MAGVGKNIGKAVQYFREKLFPGFGGQQEMAKKVGISVPLWYKYEKLKGCKLSTVHKIAGYLGVTADELLEKDAEINGARHTDISIPPYVPLAQRVVRPVAEISGVVSLPELSDVALPPGTSFLRVPGSALEPFARDGQRVFLLPANESPVNGDKVAIWTTERPPRILFRYFGVWADNNLYTYPINQSEGGMVPIPRENIKAIRVIVGIWYG